MSHQGGRASPTKGLDRKKSKGPPGRSQLLKAKKCCPRLVYYITFNNNKKRYIGMENTETSNTMTKIMESLQILTLIIFVPTFPEKLP